MTEQQLLDMLPMVMWCVGNLLFALVGPLAMIVIAKKIAKSPVTLKGNILTEVLGDGFLFFYSLLIVISLLYDAIKDLLQVGDKLSLGLFVVVSIVSSVFVPANLVVYLLALKNRTDSPNEGKEFAVWSLLFLGGALALTLAVRGRGNLW